METVDKPSAVFAATQGAPGSSPKEPFVGNVSKCIPLPPDCEDPKRKGLLQFDACFEGGENNSCY